MSLLTSDVGQLFALMQASYGHQWPHTGDAIPVWQQKLSQFTADRVMQAASLAIEAYPDFPPSIGQFIAVLKMDQPIRKQTYLPPPSMSQARAIANRLMMQVIKNYHGVDENTLQCMVDTKTAALKDLDRTPDDAFLIDLEQQLNELAENQNTELKQRATAIAWESFCVRQGIPKSDQYGGSW